MSLLAESAPDVMRACRSALHYHTHPIWRAEWAIAAMDTILKHPRQIGPMKHAPEQGLFSVEIGVIHLENIAGATSTCKVRYRPFSIAQSIVRASSSLT